MGGRNGGADCTAWETLLMMERFDDRAGEMDQGAITLVLDLPKAFERVSFQLRGLGRLLALRPQKG